MSVLAYYDSCVFLQAHNATHAEHVYCASITSPENISWEVCICSELIMSETTIEELLQQFQVSCATYGIVIRDMGANQSSQVKKQYASTKRTLSQMGLKQRDWLHLGCALFHDAKFFCSVDLDFWDSTNKANPKSNKKKTGTKRAIESALPLEVVLPSELIAAHR